MGSGATLMVLHISEASVLYCMMPDKLCDCPMASYFSSSAFFCILSMLCAGLDGVATDAAAPVDNVQQSDVDAVADAMAEDAAVPLP